MLKRGSRSPSGIIQHSYGRSLARVRFPRLPTNTLTSRAETANSIATRICRRTGKYSRSIRESGLNPIRREIAGLSYPCEMTILLGNRIRQSRWQALVFLAVLLNRTARHEIL